GPDAQGGAPAGGDEGVGRVPGDQGGRVARAGGVADAVQRARPGPELAVLDPGVTVEPVEAAVGGDAQVDGAAQPGGEHLGGARVVGVEVAHPVVDEVAEEVLAGVAPRELGDGRGVEGPPGDGPADVAVVGVEGAPEPR